MRTLAFADLKQVYFIQNQFLCKATFNRTLVKNYLMKKSQLKLTDYPKNVLANFSCL